MRPHPAGRREALLTAAAGIATVIAGCIGDDDDAAGERDEVDVEIAAVRAELAEAGRTIEAGVEADPEDLADARETIDEANASLRAVEESADDEQLVMIAFLRGVAAWLQSSMVAGEAFALWQTRFSLAFANFEAGRYGEAMDDLESADENLEAAERHRSTALGTYEDLDDQGLETLEDFDHTAVAEWLEVELRDGIISARGLTDGFSELVPAVEQLTAALETLEAEEWATAEEEFTAARDQFAIAEDTFRAAEEGAPVDEVDDLEALQTFSANLKLAADHYRAATIAAQDDDFDRFEEEIATAESYLAGEGPEAD